MLERFECVICERTVSMDTENPLHFTNWSLPNKISRPVCSQFCKDVVVKEYELAIAKDFATRRASIEEYEERIKLLYVMLNDWLDDGDIPVDVEDGWVKALWRGIQDVIDPD